MPSPPPTPDDPVHAADVINMREQPSPGWRRVAAFGVDYGLVVIYLGFLGLVGVLGRAIGVLPTDVTTPAGRVADQRRPGGLAALAAADGAEAHHPLELAHTAVWNLLVWPGDQDAALSMLLLGLANAAIVVDLASLFVGSRRTPYDRVAGTVVVPVRQRSATRVAGGLIPPARR